MLRMASTHSGPKTEVSPGSSVLLRQPYRTAMRIYLPPRSEDPRRLPVAGVADVLAPPVGPNPLNALA